MARYPAQVFVDLIDKKTIEVNGVKVKLRFMLQADHMESNTEMKVTVLNLHPLGAEQFNSDIETNQMIRFLCKQDYQVLTFVNLFPYNVGTSEQFRELASDDSLKEFILMNRESIKLAISNCDTFILAWGDRPSYIMKKRFDEAVQFVYQLIEETGLLEDTFVFKYGHSHSVTRKGNPESPKKKVIEEILPISDFEALTDPQNRNQLG